MTDTAKTRAAPAKAAPADAPAADETDGTTMIERMQAAGLMPDPAKRETKAAAAPETKA